MDDMGKTQGPGARHLRDWPREAEPSEETTAVPVSFEELERRAREKLPPEIHDFVAGGAGGEETMRANRQAFQRWWLLPRTLRDVSRCRTDIELLGARQPAPVVLAPLGSLAVVDPEGEVAVARAAASAGLTYVLSNASSHGIEAVAEAMGDAPRWFQLYISPDHKLNASFLNRAQAAGYSAVVVTVDTKRLGWRERLIERGYNPHRVGHGLGVYLSDPHFRGLMPESAEEDHQALFDTFAQVVVNDALTIEDVRRLRDQTPLPILLKGILHPEEAAEAVEHGVSGIIVSNHGGRQLEGAISALDALPGIVKAVAGRAAVLLDGGVRRGPDALKAIALGADAVMLGRPYVYGLALAGERGVAQVLRNFLADFHTSLALVGCGSVEELDASFITEGPWYGGGVGPAEAGDAPE